MTIQQFNPDQPPPPSWTPIQRRHMQWLALPRAARQPPTREKWAAVIGRSRRTLNRWEQLPGFIDAVWAISRNQPR